MAIGSVLAFWIIAILLIVMPGADWAFTISAGLSGRSVVAAVGGLVIGYAAMTAVVAAGVGVLVARSPGVLTGLSLAGGAYLMWHGATTAAKPSTAHTSAMDRPARTDWQVLARGIGVSGLNPKGLLLFLALVPQFTSPRASWPVAAQTAALGLVFLVTCGAFYLGLGSVARTALYARPAAATIITRLSGLAMVTIGALLIVDRLVS